ncbi:hypothetical protein [Parafannyhessea umbonata]|uniref:hypothetical protein n=1 Tax=Parafannyhessea umbonata TaxID=604330 RepID=UPI00359C1E64
MAVNAYEAYIAMYYALEAADIEKGKEALTVFLTDADPLLFTGKGSADPAVFSGFSRSYADAYKAGANEEDALDFVRRYLQSTNDPSLLEAFDSVVDESSWKEALEAIRN